MTSYESATTIRDARALYFDANGFGDGGYEKSWVKFMAGPLPFYIPNTAARVRSVRLHDIHHVLTGYDTTWTGESEIAAWEIASGCADHWAAWGLNFSGLAIGLFIDPRAVYRAFIRGRGSRNLYEGEYDDSMLAETVGSLRVRLALDRAAPPAGVRDRLAFAGWSAVSLAFAAAPPVLLLLAILSLA